MERYSRRFYFCSLPVILILPLLFWVPGLPGVALADNPRPYVTSTSGCDCISQQAVPISLGVSGGNITDQTRQNCCTGTLGCLVQDGGGVQYILSNNHVLAKTNKGGKGDPIIQPGLVDLEHPCNSVISTNYNDIANLSKFVTIKFNSKSVNYVDAAIAQVMGGMVRTDGAINCLGAIDPNPASASLGLAVQKCGRTTGLTSGAIGAINVSLTVAYNKSCGTNARYAVFANQLRIDTGGFSAGGDSGALILTKPTSGAPQPVGLLFAGSITQTFANPIQTVLSALGNLSVVGSGVAGTGMAATAPEEESTEVTKLKGVQGRHEKVFMQIPGVVGMGIGRSKKDQTLRLEIYVEKLTPELQSQLPESLEGTAVQIMETGEVRAL